MLFVVCSLPRSCVGLLVKTIRYFKKDITTLKTVDEVISVLGEIPNKDYLLCTHQPLNLPRTPYMTIIHSTRDYNDIQKSIQQMTADNTGIPQWYADYNINNLEKWDGFWKKRCDVLLEYSWILSHQDEFIIKMQSVLFPAQQEGTKLDTMEILKEMKLDPLDTF